ncbi:MAG: beta-ketoacyl-[acyl-carrier-protein] synthase family protein [Planctomycetota bacterium]|nr:beta-ketoacyl-[acyl-carrier-protein] synthase family protein [Planctomycetota bacterium]
MSGTRRVVISGMGWVTPLGCELESVWQRLLGGESGVGRITRFHAGTFSTNFAAEVRDFDFKRTLANWASLGASAPDGAAAATHPHAGYNSQFALGAAAQAWTQSGLASHRGLDRKRFGIYLGAGEGVLDFDNYVATNLASYEPATRTCNAERWAEVGRERFSASLEAEQAPNMPLSHLAGAFGCRGPALNCLTACAASTQAIGEAWHIIKRGDADVMFAGGTHTMIHPLGVTGFIRLTALSSRRDEIDSAARPFDVTRDGFVMGEGAGMLILESLEHWQARTSEARRTGLAGVPEAPLAEIAGYGSSADAFRITDIHPEGKGAQAAMNQALRQAGVEPRALGPDGSPLVQYVSAHGTGTKENDKIETVAVKGVFGPLAPKIPVSSVKSMFGHLIAAAGAVELITCVMAIRTGWLPPTINLRHPDAECDLDYIPNQARSLRDPRTGASRVRLCLSNSFGFGGQNDTLAVRAFES